MNVEVTIPKCDIGRYHNLIGMANAPTVTLAGTDYGPGEIAFHGFVGRHIGNQMYAGSFIYGPADGLATRIEDFPTAEAVGDAEQYDND